MAALGVGAVSVLAVVLPPVPQVKAAGIAGFEAALASFGIASAAVTAGNIGKAIAGDYAPLIYDVASQALSAGTPLMGIGRRFSKGVAGNLKNGLEGYGTDKVKGAAGSANKGCPGAN